MMPTADIILVVAFAASMVGTPGPANMLLFASGFSFGFRRTLPFLLGTIGGFQVVSLAGAAGLGSVLAASPEVFGTLKLASVAYIVYLAIKIVTSNLSGSAATQHWGILRGVVVHPLNPKAYAMVIAAYVTFGGNGADYAQRAVVIFLVFLLVSFPLNSLWALAGSLVQNSIADSRAIQAIKIILAVLMVSVVVYAAWLI